MRLVATVVAFAVLAVLLAGPALAGPGYEITNLVSDGIYPAAHTDPNLKNPWGLVFNPTGFSWVADNGTGLSTLYDGAGNPQSLVVSVPGNGGPAAPTGIVFNGTSKAFVVSDGMGNSGASAFIFASEDGTISGWSPAVPPPPPSTVAHVAVPAANDAEFKGLAIGNIGTDPFLYAADFHNARVSAFDKNFAPASLGAGAFTDANIPAGYAPFGIQNIGNLLYVTYALVGPNGDDVGGPGNGFVDVFDTSGNLVHHLIAQGALNSPWGLALAPANFGAFSGALLVGNFGDGRINAYDPTTGALLGTLNNTAGNPFSIDGLWALQFGNGFQGQAPNVLFFTAGPGDEQHGLYGSISAVPEPTGLAGAGLAAMCFVIALWRRRREVRTGR